MKKRFFVMVCAVAALVVVAIESQSCKAQRVITATGYTIVSSENSQKADSVRCSFKLEETYSGVQNKKK